MEKNVRIQDSLHAIGIQSEDGIETVSYTHLDVYKRQLVHLYNKELKSFGCIYLLFVTTIHSIVLSKMVADHSYSDFYPVSYTHLDVYKRQR